MKTSTQATDRNGAGNCHRITCSHWKIGPIANTWISVEKILCPVLPYGKVKGKKDEGEKEKSPFLSFAV
jgi:hypothetical protein